MAHFDVFNGDADGLCALQQLRLDNPLRSTLITGVKRDIALLRRAEAGIGDGVTVLDVSLDTNREALMRVLERGARVQYFDHHFPGEIPSHPGFEAHIGTRPDEGTSLIVNRHLGGRHLAWAVVGTFGDNFDGTARRLAGPLGLDGNDLALLRELGIYLNYNGYGAAVADLWFPPDELFRRLHPYADPLRFIAEDPAFSALKEGYESDMAQCARLRPEVETERHALYLLPAEAWARRVSGVFANQLAETASERAHALLTRLPDGGFVVSVRAPLARPVGADALCRAFPTGGGRKAAGGINRLEDEDYGAFLRAFLAAF